MLQTYNPFSVFSPYLGDSIPYSHCSYSSHLDNVTFGCINEIRLDSVAFPRAKSFLKKNEPVVFADKISLIASDKYVTAPSEIPVSEVCGSRRTLQRQSHPFSVFEAVFHR